MVVLVGVTIMSPATKLIVSVPLTSISTTVLKSLRTEPYIPSPVAPGRFAQFVQDEEEEDGDALLIEHLSEDYLESWSPVVSKCMDEIITSRKATRPMKMGVRRTAPATLPAPPQHHKPALPPSPTTASPPHPSSRGNRTAHRAHCGVSPSPPRTANNKPRRRRVLDRLKTPLSRNLLFVNAIVEDDVCFGFAAASANNFCEGSGTPYDFKMKCTRSEHSDPPGDCFRSFINPKDVVRFSMANTDHPSFIVGCDLDRLLTSTDSQIGSLLNDCCQMRPLGSVRRHLCNRCGRLAAFVEEGGGLHPRLFCKLHATDRDPRHFKLYLPSLVSLSARGRRVWLCVFDGPTIDESAKNYGGLVPDRSLSWLPLAYRDLDCTPLRKHNPSDEELLFHIARGCNIVKKQKLEGPVDTVKLLQKLCALFQTQELCTEEILPLPHLSVPVLSRKDCVTLPPPPPAPALYRKERSTARRYSSRDRR